MERGQLHEKPHSEEQGTKSSLVCNPGWSRCPCTDIRDTGWEGAHIARRLKDWNRAPEERRADLVLAPVVAALPFD